MLWQRIILYFGRTMHTPISSFKAFLNVQNAAHMMTIFLLSSLPIGRRHQNRSVRTSSLLGISWHSGTQKMRHAAE